MQIASGTRTQPSSYDKTIRAWNSTNGKELCVLKGHSGPILDLVGS